MLLAEPGVHLALVIRNDGEIAEPVPGESKRARIGRALFSAYRRYLLRPAMRERASVGIPLPDMPEVRCRVRRKGRFSQYFEAEDVEAIKAHDLDFILRFGFNILRGDILTAARYGVWSYHHGDEQKYRGGPPCFWEIVHGDPVTGAVLQRLTNRLDGGIVLRKGYFATVEHSYARNIDSVYAESARWPLEVVRDIKRGVADYLHAPPSSTSAPIYHAPHNGAMLRFGWRLGRNTTKRAFESLLLRAEWNVGVVSRPIHDLLEAPPKWQASWLRTRRRGQFLADPFALADANGLHVLAEDYDREVGKGVISHVRLRREQESEPTPVLTLPTHMSYPYAFEHQGERYCVPETAEERVATLYRATQFPRLWEPDGVLLANMAAVDSTLFEWEGRWWLACTDAEQGANLRLLLWYADNPRGPWTPHPGNPVKTDVRSSRPAGTPFVINGVLYRPAQNCSRSYGGSITLNRVLKLSETEFEEDTILSLVPHRAARYNAGIHTVSAVGSMTLIDGKRMVFVSSALRRTLGRKARALNVRLGGARLARREQGVCPREDEA